MAGLVDCFSFLNEYEILKIRLHELGDIVDHFVLVEATRTFSGNAKPLFFDQRKDEFRQWPIEHVVIDKYPAPIELRTVYVPQKVLYHRDLHRMDNWQKNQAWRAIEKLQPDYVLVGDVDEIPMASTVGVEISHYREPLALLQSLHYRYLNLEYTLFGNSCWTRLMSYDDLVMWPEVREIGWCVPDGGWHFSYTGTPDQVRYKMQSYAHQELDPERWPVSDLKTTTRSYPLARLPAWVRDNEERFRDMGWLI